MTPVIQKAAADAGFSAVGITTADAVDGAHHLREAMADHRIASMGWLARNPEARFDPHSLLSSAQSVICCAMPHRFVRGEDYHDTVRKRLEKLWGAIVREHPQARAKLCVDTSPIAEKALAARAGLGWIGKHAVLVNRDLGSFFVLGEIITDLQLPPDAPVSDECGNCRACLDACPTRALIAPHTLDARRCLSYLTLEHRGAIPEDMLAPISEATFGCEICQQACPFNSQP